MLPAIRHGAGHDLRPVRQHIFAALMYVDTNVCYLYSTRQ